MKDALLLLLGKYKLFCLIFTGLIVFISIIYAYIFTSIVISNFAILIIAWAFFVSLIWNVSYVYAPSVNENSNIYDVVSRWGLIMISLIILTYGVVNICFHF